MIQVYARLNHIDYMKLLTVNKGSEKTDEPKKLSFIEKIFKKLIDFTKKKVAPRKLKKIVEMDAIISIKQEIIIKIAKKYGLYFSAFQIGKNISYKNKLGENEMLSFTVSIQDIDYEKLGGIFKPTEKKNSSADNSIIPKAIEIVKPFINETMATVPPKAIAELINLLAREKIIKMAEECGITVSDLKVDAI